jgi:hypothetical protein
MKKIIPSKPASQSPPDLGGSKRPPIGKMSAVPAKKPGKKTA